MRLLPSPALAGSAKTRHANRDDDAGRPDAGRPPTTGVAARRRANFGAEGMSSGLDAVATPAEAADRRADRYHARQRRAPIPSPALLPVHCDRHGRADRMAARPYPLPCISEYPYMVDQRVDVVYEQG